MPSKPSKDDAAKGNEKIEDLPQKELAADATGTVKGGATTGTGGKKKGG
jgi:hypothetical protein